MGDLDIAIAGCGIAGLAAALLLRRQGHAVTLYERFDAPRPLGSGLMLQPTGLAVLAALGLAGEVAECSAPIVRIHGRNTLGEIVLDARYADLGVAWRLRLRNPPREPVRRAARRGRRRGHSRAHRPRGRGQRDRGPRAGACCSRRPIPRRRTTWSSTRSACHRRW
jgi:2-polyprenyl-6-methoxyphenol hydroxylase-like FAD-dependent oxidoreductase